MDDPPIAFDFDQLDDDDIIAELALQQFHNTELDYVGHVVSNPGPYVGGEEETQPYVDGYVPMEGMQHNSEGYVWGFEMLDLPPFIPSLPRQIVNHEGSQDSMSDWTFLSPAPSRITLAPLAPSHPSSSISDSFDSFNSFTSYSNFPIMPLSEFQNLLDIEGPIASHDDGSTIGAQAVGYDAQDVAFGNDLVMVDKEQEDFQQKSSTVTGECAVASASRYFERSDATISESPSAISASSGRSTASADRTEEGRGEGRARGGTRKKKKKKEHGGTCKQCHRVFTREADARRHELTRHNFIQIPCMVCGKPCSRPDALKRHLDNSCGKGRKPGRKPKVPR